jgi:2-polyprenyl-3-methyl-5-hydroxy-6-metoxy-1,4-benzoquinol methylase
MENVTDVRRDELLILNKEQAQFYDTPHVKRNLNNIMKLWSHLRRRMYYLMQNSGIWKDVYALQKEWMGDLAGKKVLDFGCYDGNALSGYLAENSASYLAVDLSKPALERLDDYFRKKGIKGARVQSVDVLSKDFTETGFDVIYAEGVLHHFKHIDALLPVLSEKLAPGGLIVSLDPLQTSFLTRSVRAVYHPFRSDREWEWPFTRYTFDEIRRFFTIKKVQGVVGYSKWAIPIAFFHKSVAVRIAKYLHRKDIASAGSERRSLWGCMQVVMCLEKIADR